ILDADKQGFLRSERSLIQTSGRAARNSNGHDLMHAAKRTDSMQHALDETARRRETQIEFNEKHNITPTTINKEIRDVISAHIDIKEDDKTKKKSATKKLTKSEREKLLEKLEKEMKEAARDLDFETASELRDAIFEIQAEG